MQSAARLKQTLELVCGKWKVVVLTIFWPDTYGSTNSATSRQNYATQADPLRARLRTLLGAAGLKVELFKSTEEYLTRSMPPAPSLS